MSNTILLPFQPNAMTPAQLAAVSYLARYSGHTHQLYSYSFAAGSLGARRTGSTR
jgi:integrase/recombinase XerD